MFEKLKEIIEEKLNAEGAAITEETSFKELVMALEDEFDVEIPSEELEKLATVKDVMDYLAAKGIEM